MFKGVIFSAWARKFFPWALVHLSLSIGYGSDYCSPSLCFHFAALLILVSPLCISSSKYFFLPYDCSRYLSQVRIRNYLFSFSRKCN